MFVDVFEQSHLKCLTSQPNSSIYGGVDIWCIVFGTKVATSASIPTDAVEYISLIGSVRTAQITNRIVHSVTISSIRLDLSFIPDTP